MATNQGKWKPGFKHDMFRPGRIAKETTTVVLNIENHNFRITTSSDVDPDMPEGWGRDFHVTVGNGQKFISFDPTHMTADDIEKLRDFFDLVFALAMPVVKRRDELAEQGRRKGDDTFTRLYRRVSQLVVRQSQVREYDQSVYDRCKWLLGRLGTDGNSAGRPGDSGSPVAERRPEDVGEADDGPKGNES